MKILRTITLCCLACLSLQATAQSYKLWYDKPALVWTDALPLGNGRLGTFVVGIFKEVVIDKLVSNEKVDADDLWADIFGVCAGLIALVVGAALIHIHEWLAV